MSEMSKYEAYKKKMQGVCDENNLVFRFRHTNYPITLTIRPISGMDEQMSMLESVEENGYTSPDAAIVFSYKDGILTYKMSETFTISDALFSKIKNLFKNMHSMWLQFFYRDVIEKGILTAKTMPTIEEDAEDEESDADMDADGDEIQEDDTDADDMDGESDTEIEDSEKTEEADNEESSENADNSLLQAATLLVREIGQVTISLLQRKLKIGYSEAARLMDELEDNGVIGPFNGSGPREVLLYDQPENSDADYDEGSSPDEA